MTGTTGTDLTPASGRALRFCFVMHDEHRALAGIARDRLYQLYGLVAYRATGAEDFNFRLAVSGPPLVDEGIVDECFTGVLHPTFVMVLHGRAQLFIK